MATQDWRRTGQILRTDQKEALSNAESGISQKMVPVIAQWAKDHDYTLIIDLGNTNSSVVFDACDETLLKM